MEIRWKRPPARPSDVPGQPTGIAWSRVAGELRQRPGKWALIATYPDSEKCKKAAGRIRNDHTDINAIEYDVKSSGTELYLRYSGVTPGARFDTLVKIRSGKSLRETIANREMTYRYIAKRVGVSYQRIGQLVDETYPRIQAVIAADIEDALDVPRGTLFAPLDNAEVFRSDPDGTVPHA